MRLLSLIVFSALFTQNGFAQNSGELDAVSSGQAWYEVNFTHAVNRLVLQCDLQMSNINDTNHQYNLNEHLGQLGARGWVHYYVTPRVKLSASVGFWDNINVQEVGQSASFEIRPAVQAQHLFNTKRFTLYNRVRFENRFVHHDETNDFTYTPRIRYMPKVFVPLNSKSIRKKTWYLIALDEIFLNVSQGRPVDQNRATLGLGYCFTDDIVLETCYTYQSNYKTNAPYEITHALGITLSINNIMKVLKVQ